MSRNEFVFQTVDQVTPEESREVWDCYVAEKAGSFHHLVAFMINPHLGALSINQSTQSNGALIDNARKWGLIRIRHRMQPSKLCHPK